MLFQASAEKSELVLCYADADEETECGGGGSPADAHILQPGLRNVQKSRSLPPAPDFTPTMIPSTINAISARVLAVVKMFCTSLPRFNPRVFMKGQQRDHRQTEQLCGRK